jgi:phosphate transport system permease protein
MANGSAAKRRGEWMSRGLFTFCAALVIAVMAALFIFVGANAYQTFTTYHISPGDFFLGRVWSPDDRLVGSLILIVGSIVATVLAIVVATPISVGVALFVTQISPPWARRLMQPVLELLTGIPSIIYGFLGLLVLVPLIAKIYNTIAGGFFSAGFGIAAAAIVLAVMILPTITTISIDALAALPGGLREASLALGATRWQTIRRTLLPAASAGIFTGVILGTGRAIGETLAVSYVIGGNVGNFPIKFTDVAPYIQFPPTSTITVQLLFDFQEASNPSLNYSAIWTLAFVLLLISFLLVVASRWIASRGVYTGRQSSGRTNGFFRRLAGGWSAARRGAA